MVRYTIAHLHSHHKLLGTEEMVQWVRVTGFKSPIHTLQNNQVGLLVPISSRDRRVAGSWSH